METASALKIKLSFPIWKNRLQLYVVLRWKPAAGKRLNFCLHLTCEEHGAKVSPSARAEAYPTARTPVFFNSNNKNDLRKNWKTTSSYYFRTINESILHKAFIFRSSHKISNSKIAIIKKFVFMRWKFLFFSRLR